jgi:hypothetical protein
MLAYRHNKSTLAAAYADEREPSATHPATPHARFAIGPERYSRMHRLTNVPIRMRDGAVLFADLTQPGDIAGPPMEPLPVVVNLTPHNKTLSRTPGAIARFAAAVGSAQHHPWCWDSSRHRPHVSGRDS